MHVTKFLLRWLYLNNLIRDRAEIQTIPHIQQHHILSQQQQQPQPQPQPQQHDLQYGNLQQEQQQQTQAQQQPMYSSLQEYQQSQPQQQQNYESITTTPRYFHETPQSPSTSSSSSLHPPLSHLPPPPHHLNPQPTSPILQHQKEQQQAQMQRDSDAEWKAKALHGIALYPPGTPRLLALDSLRLEIVHELARELNAADEAIRNYHHQQQQEEYQRQQWNFRDGGEKRTRRHERDGTMLDDDGTNDNDTDPNRIQIHEGVHHEEEGEDEEVDPFLDADLEIIRAIREATLRDLENGKDGLLSTSLSATDNNVEGGDDVDIDYRLNISNDGNKDQIGSSGGDGEQAVLVISPGSSATQVQRSQQDTSRSNAGDTANDLQSRHQPNEKTSSRHQNHDHHNDIHDSDYNDNGDYITEEQLKQSHSLLLETCEYLPQLVSAILHSPPALLAHQHHHQHLDPLATLRRLLITRCVRDPNLGIALCWLLEAEVGRAWKTLFEHRQQTGRRLIVVLPAEKAAVIAKIGTEKRSAFDLLQDVESATAYGMFENGAGGTRDGSGFGMDYNERMTGHGIVAGTLSGNGSLSSLYSTPRLPASLSLRRCSHFGDTMHFIDRLTQISLDLRLVPSLQRKAYLQESLSELNRRLRRRMVTNGDVSLDVEDNRGPHDWPTESDVTLEMLKYSVHFPLEPQCHFWPGGNGMQFSSSADFSNSAKAAKRKHGVMRILNIVSPECRLLASRERCPFMVHCEVAETGLEGSDARLYASGAKGIGATLEEVMGMASRAKMAGSHRNPNDYTSGFTSYQIPSELVMNDSFEKNISSGIDQGKDSPQNVEAYNENDKDLLPMSSINEETLGISAAKNFPRGGWQNGDDYFPPIEGGGYSYPSPYDLVRQEQLEQLHEQLQSHQQHPHYGPYQSQYETGVNDKSTPLLTSYAALLDRVFGLPWSDKCEQIRQASPYGKVKGWRLASFIMKAGEDIRREALVMQVISKLKGWFENEISEANRPYLRPYTIMCVGGDAGLLECVKDAKSVDEVKKETDGFTSLREYFERAYGPPRRVTRRPSPESPNIGVASQQMGQVRQRSSLDRFQSTGVEINFETAQDNFLRSLVGYSLVCYILQIKDRHNANILLDREGHLMHIDFGFVLGDTPKMGKVPLFSERAPFKLTSEFWDVIGGWNFNEGGLGVRFCKMFEEAFACASSHSDEIVSLIEAAVLNLTRNPNEARSLANGVKARLRMRGARDSVLQKTFIMDLVNTALTSWGTSTYDWLQKSMNGYI